MPSADFGNHSQPCAKSKRIKRAVLIIVIVIAVLAISSIIYIAVIQPVLAKHLYKPTAVHDDISCYENNSYLTFESGERFGAFLSKNEIIASAKPVGFYHIDNKERDNPLYGKQCDIFSLDIVVTEEQFLAEKNRILGDSSDNLWSEGDFVFYIAEDKTHENGDILMIAFCEKDARLRYILITDLDPYTGTDDQYSKGIKYAGVVLHNSGIRWEVQ